MARKELDRFDTHAKRDIQISLKLVALTGFSIIASCIIVATVSILIFNNGFKKTIDATIDKAVYGVNNTITTWSNDLQVVSTLASGNAGLINSIEENNTSAIQKATSVIFDNSATDFIAVTDTSGTVIACNGEGISSKSNLSSASVIQQALRGHNASTVEALGNLNYTMAAASPIYSNGKIKGTVVVGYDFITDNESDSSLKSIVSKSYGIDFTVFQGNVRISTTLKSADGKSLVGTKLNNPEIENVVLTNGKEFRGSNMIAGMKYDCAYMPISSGDGTITGMFFVAKSYDDIASTVTTTVKSVIPITIIIALALIICCYLFVRWLMWRIYNVTRQLTEMSTGEADLTKRVKLLIRDEIGDLVIQFDAFCDKLQGIVKEMKNTKEELKTTGSDLSAGTEDATSAITQIIANINSIHDQIKTQGTSVSQTAEAVGEISQNIRSLDKMIETQSTGVEQASAAVEQMIGNIQSVNTSVDKMANSFESLSTNAQTGFSKQQDVNERIKQIENQSEMLQEANLAISSIAEQTNLLAMNAAIEAAHAGEAGKGFSVVADEIRKLSETSSAQSKTIGEQLNKIKDSITEVVSASTESSEAFTAVSNKIKETDELVMQIKAAMEEQNSGSKQISEALKNMNDSAIEVQSASKSMSARNEKIMREINTLQDATSTMNVSMQEMSVGARKINETGTALGDVSHKVQDSIDKIGSQIDLFRV